MMLVTPILFWTNVVVPAMVLDNLARRQRCAASEHSKENLRKHQRSFANDAQSAQLRGISHNCLASHVLRVRAGRL